LPAAPRPLVGENIAWVVGEAAVPTGRVGVALVGDRMAVARDGEPVLVGPASLDKLRDAQIVCHDAKSLRVAAVDDTLIAAYLIEPGRAEYPLDDLSAEYGLELVPEPAAD